MSSAATNSDSPGEAKLPLPPVAVDQNMLMKEISVLHSKVSSAIERVAQLEKAAGLTEPRLVAIDSPAMKFALELCDTIFPGSTTNVEVINDPDEPGRSWYSVNIRWQGQISDSLARETEWHHRFDQAYGEVANDFAICVDLS
jgi:hypothetical protein